MQLKYDEHQQILRNNTKLKVFLFKMSKKIEMKREKGKRTEKWEDHSEDVPFQNEQENGNEEGEGKKDREMRKPQ